MTTNTRLSLDSTGEASVDSKNHSAISAESAVLRISEAEAATAAAITSTETASTVPTDNSRVLLNMGPSHPSTHGVLRLLLELSGETVLRSKPIIGYLHTGMEKTAENLTYVQGGTNVTRMDYASPLFTELAYSMAVERLLEIEIPDRAVWIRMLMCELNRMSSHLLFMATNGMDLGAVSMMIYGWREREEVLRFFEKVTGLRMNHNYIRPGGVAADLPAGWRDDVSDLLELIEPRLDEYDTLLTDQPIWRERLQDVGIITTEEALALGATGPLLRASGMPWDLRRDEPYMFYDQVDFDVVVGDHGDCYDRYAVRLNEIRESMRIVSQIADIMPEGDFRSQNKKITPPPRTRINESMEALIHHFKIFTEGFQVPVGDVYAAVESPRGELGVYIVSNGTSKPYRLHVRAPSFVNLQCLPHLMHNGLIADGVAIISSVDPIMGEVDR
ncbi:MAG: NADH-quinone oxidoreductase subunit D [Acidimicrobiaceae bacterium]|nr:NADH-quinone oxidoreductase subunit D [Acidimicrobiaceae bacterium]